MTVTMKPDDPRIDIAVKILLGYPKGLPRDAVVDRMGLSVWVGREALRAGREAGRLVWVHLGNGNIVWTAAMHGKKLAAAVKAEATRASRARQKAKRAALKAQRAGQAPGKMYNREFDLDSVRDLPVRQASVSTWSAMRQPPGPTSIFDLGARHA